MSRHSWPRFGIVVVMQLHTIVNGNCKEVCMYPNLLGLQILILDDQLAQSAFGVDCFLTRLGGTVHTATTVDAAISCIKAQPEAQMFHAVVIDYQINGSRPGTDFALWLWSHQSPATTQIRRICYSGTQKSAIQLAIPALAMFDAIIENGTVVALQELCTSLCPC